MSEGLLTIVVPTTGKNPYLWECLSSIAGVAGHSFVKEVLVVVNGASSALSESRLTQFLAEQDPSIASKFVKIAEPVPGLLAGRHRGMREARGTYLSFIDDDVLLGTEWVEAVREVCETGLLADRIAGGSVVPDFRGNPPSWLYRFRVEVAEADYVLSELSLVEIGSDQISEVSPLLVFGLNFTISQQTLEDLGGFHPDLTPPDLLRFRGDGETAIANKLMQNSRSAIFHPGLQVRHIIGTDRLNLGYFCKIWVRQGISDQFADLKGAHAHGSLAAVGTVEIVRVFLKKAKRAMFASMPSKRGRATELLRQLCLALGRLYLWRMFRADRRVQEWILRDSYVDYRYP